mmetsp:Transcript_29425/g.77609  ORF Transcript_29425/g.77609 Transcript_29425/m.77609 type:complete len:337 (-) Transcript_29425:137-1147(-)
MRSVIEAPLGNSDLMCIWLGGRKSIVLTMPTSSFFKGRFLRDLILILKPSLLEGLRTQSISIGHGSSYLFATMLWCETATCAGSVTFSIATSQPYGMSRWDQTEVFARPSNSGSDNSLGKFGSTRALSKAASLEHSPHTHKTPSRTCAGRAAAQARGFSNNLGKSFVFACGIAVIFPSPLKCQPWYEQRSVPSLSTRPSLRGTFLCGQRSSKTRHAPSPLFQATRSSPRSSSFVGRLGSKSSMTAIGYQAFFQLNCSPHVSASTSLSITITEGPSDLVLCCRVMRDNRRLRRWRPLQPTTATNPVAAARGAKLEGALASETAAGAAVPGAICTCSL